MVVPILFCMLAVLVQGAVCARWPRWRYDVVALCLLAGVAAAVLLVSSAGQDSVQYSVLLADGTAKIFDTQAAAEEFMAHSDAARGLETVSPTQWNWPAIFSVAAAPTACALIYIVLWSGTRRAFEK